MLDLSVIILTYNEEIHIARCLDSVCSYAKDVYIIDSYSNDKTLDIAGKYDRVSILQHKWENDHSKQFNWALQNAPISTEWVLRLDADEYLMPELVEELKDKLPFLPASVTGVVFKRRHIFMNRWVRRGVYPVKLLRLFRTGKAVCESRLMDEHIILLEGSSVEFDHDFCDHNLNDLSWFCHKHVNYAVREAAEMISLELSGSNTLKQDDRIGGDQARDKRRKKYKYSRFPLFWRSFAYFLYRYFIKLGFLDGKEGFLWHFLQGLWYRTLVDAKILEIKRECGSDIEKIQDYLDSHYAVKLPSIR